MPQHKSCEKRMRTSAAARLRNRQDRARARTLEKVVTQATDKASAQTNLNLAYKTLDQLVAKGVLSSNTAGRHKSKLARSVKRLTA